MTNKTPALGICLEEYEYPYPVQFFPLSNDLQPLKMAYMDVPPGKEPNGKTVVLFHGKAFGCYYFRNVIEALTGAGYRAGPGKVDVTWVIRGLPGSATLRDWLPGCFPVSGGGG